MFQNDQKVTINDICLNVLPVKTLLMEFDEFLNVYINIGKISIIQ